MDVFKKKPESNFFIVFGKINCSLLTKYVQPKELLLQEIGQLERHSEIFQIGLYVTTVSNRRSFNINKLKSWDFELIDNSIWYS